MNARQMPVLKKWDSFLSYQKHREKISPQQYIKMDTERKLQDLIIHISTITTKKKLPNTSNFRIIQTDWVNYFTKRLSQRKITRVIFFQKQKQTLIRSQPSSPDSINVKYCLWLWDLAISLILWCPPSTLLLPSLDTPSGSLCW